jgi:hypothetical protein
MADGSRDEDRRARPKAEEEIRSVGYAFITLP